MSDRLTTAGEALRDARKRAGMTLRDASWFVDVHFSYLSKVENGHERPGDYLVLRLCNLYGMDPEPMLLERAVSAVPEPVRAAIAARAVDEALSVERVAEALHGDISRCYADDHRYGVALCEPMAAALVAHLRGER